MTKSGIIFIKNELCYKKAVFYLNENENISSNLEKRLCFMHNYMR